MCVSWGALPVRAGSGSRLNPWDTASLRCAARAGGDRVGQTVGQSTTTHFALDVQARPERSRRVGLPEVIYTDQGVASLHLNGVIVTENRSR